VVSLEASQVLMSPYLHKKLNPMLLRLVSVKGVPPKPVSCKPVYAAVEFLDGSRSFKTHRLPQLSQCKFNHEHCFLMGQHDPALLQELISTKQLKVLLHDNEEYSAEGSIGLAKFYLLDLLRPHCRYLKLTQNVLP
jgi:hypothetical protein